MGNIPGKSAHVSEYSGKKANWDKWSHKLLVRAYVKVLHEHMVNEKIPEFPTHVEFGAYELNLDNKNDAFEIKEAKDRLTLLRSV